MIRCIITGITMSASHVVLLHGLEAVRGVELAAQHASCEPSSIAMFRCAQPQVWNSGAAM